MVAKLCVITLLCNFLVAYYCYCLSTKDWTTCL